MDKTCPTEALVWDIPKSLGCGTKDKYKDCFGLVM